MKITRKSIRHILCGFLAGAALFAAPALAAQSNAVTSINVEAGEITISGTIAVDETVYLNDVALRVLKPGKTAADLENCTAENYAEILHNAAQVRPNGDSFQFTYPANGDSGVYTLIAVFANGDVVEKKFLMMEDDADAFLNAVNQAQDQAAMKAALEQYPYVWQDSEIYNSLEIENLLDAVSGAMVGTTYTAPSEVLERFEMECALQAIAKSESGEEAAQLVEEYSTILGLAENPVYTQLYGDLSDTAKSEISMAARQSENAPEFIATLCDDTIIRSLNGIGSWNDIPLILETARDYLTGFDFDTYDNLNEDEKDRVAMALAKASYSDVPGLERLFNQYVKDEDILNPDGGNTGGGTGGGSTGGGGSSGGSGSRGSSSGSSVVVVDQENLQQAQNSKAFLDLDSVEWARESVEYLTKIGAVNGKDPQHFVPNEAVTRSEFVKMLMGAFQVPQTETGSAFEDVREGDWYYEYVMSAVDAGVVNGISPTYFGAEEVISRQDLAVMVYRMLEKKGVALNTAQSEPFADHESISDYAVDAVYALKNAGIINGKDQGMFAPGDYATRAEAAKIIYGAIMRVGGI